MTFPVIADGHSLPGAPRQSRPGEAPPVSPGRAERPLSFPAERSEGKGIHLPAAAPLDRDPLPGCSAAAGGDSPVSPDQAKRPLSFPAERSEGKGIHRPAVAPFDMDPLPGGSAAAGGDSHVSPDRAKRPRHSQPSEARGRESNAPPPTSPRLVACVPAPARHTRGP